MEIVLATALNLVPHVQALHPLIVHGVLPIQHALMPVIEMDRVRQIYWEVAIKPITP